MENNNISLWMNGCTKKRRNDNVSAFVPQNQFEALYFRATHFIRLKSIRSVGLISFVCVWIGYAMDPMWQKNRSFFNVINFKNIDVSRSPALRHGSRHELSLKMNYRKS